IGQVLDFSCTLICNSTGGITKSIQTEKVIPLPIVQGQRTMVLNSKRKENEEILSDLDLNDDSKFTFVTYNLLSQTKITSKKQIFPTCPKFAQSWQYRQKMLLGELKDLSGDIYCLQELDMNSFDDFW